MPKVLPTILFLVIFQCSIAQPSHDTKNVNESATLKRVERFNDIFLKVDVFSELSYSTGITNPYYQNLGFGLSASMQVREVFSVGASYARTNLNGSGISSFTYTGDDYRIMIEGGIPFYKNFVAILSGSIIGQFIHERTCFGRRCGSYQGHLLYDFGAGLKWSGNRYFTSIRLIYRLPSQSNIYLGDPNFIGVNLTVGAYFFKIKR